MVWGIFSNSETKVSDLQKLVIEPATRVCNDLTTKWEALGKYVADWSEKNVPKTYAPFIKRIFDALPVALLTTLMPVYVLVPAAISCYVAHIAYGPFKQTTYDTLFHGTTLGLALKGTINLASFLVTFHPLYGLSAAIYGVGAVALAKYSKVVA